MGVPTKVTYSTPPFYSTKHLPGAEGKLSGKTVHIMDGDCLVENAHAAGHLLGG